MSNFNMFVYPYYIPTFGKKQIPFCKTNFFLCGFYSLCLPLPFPKKISLVKNQKFGIIKNIFPQKLAPIGSLKVVPIGS
jgi:hypothetical protein